MIRRKKKRKMLDIQKDWGYRKEDIQHVADSYGISYEKAEESLNFNINKREQLGVTKAFPVDEYWEKVKVGESPEIAYAKAVSDVGLPSRVIADIPQEKVVKGMSHVKRAEGGLIVLVFAFILIGCMLLMGRR